MQVAQRVRQVTAGSRPRVTRLWGLRQVLGLTAKIPARCSTTGDAAPVGANFVSGLLPAEHNTAWDLPYNLDITHRVIEVPAVEVEVIKGQGTLNTVGLRSPRTGERGLAVVVHEVAADLTSSRRPPLGCLSLAEASGTWRSWPRRRPPPRCRPGTGSVSPSCWAGRRVTAVQAEFVLRLRCHLASRTRVTLACCPAGRPGGLSASTCACSGHREADRQTRTWHRRMLAGRIRLVDQDARAGAIWKRMKAFRGQVGRDGFVSDPGLVGDRRVRIARCDRGCSGPRPRAMHLVPSRLRGRGLVRLPSPGGNQQSGQATRAVVVTSSSPKSSARMPGTTRHRTSSRRPRNNAPAAGRTTWPSGRTSCPGRRSGRRRTRPRWTGLRLAG